MNADEHAEGAVERWEQLAKQGPGVAEHILNILKAGLNAAPFTGAIASLMTDYIPSTRLRRLERFAQMAAEDLDRLQDRVRSDYLCSDDFAFMFERCFRGVAENPQRERIAVFRGILVNAAISTDLAEEEKEYFLNLAMTLSVLHIRILKFMAAPTRYLRESGIAPSGIRGGFSEFFPVAIPGVQLSVIRRAFADLHRNGMISTDESIFDTMTAQRGFDILGRRVTEVGDRFIHFCMVPE